MAKMLSDVLESGKYEQLTGMLFEHGGEKYKPRGCCLGVMEHAGGITFNAAGIDQFGCDEMPSDEVRVITGLDADVTYKEIDRIYDIVDYDGLHIDEGVQRVHALAAVNDLGEGFKPVIDVLRQLDWDVDVDELARKLAEGK